MASKQMYGVLAIFLTVLPAISLAKEFMVGDEKGWTIKFDYQAWAADKFSTILWEVTNVFKVNGTAFQDCIVPPANESLVTRNDDIPLLTPGGKCQGMADGLGSGQSLGLGSNGSLLIIVWAVRMDMLENIVRRRRFGKVSFDRQKILGLAIRSVESQFIVIANRMMMTIDLASA
ncbi:hypothetical protein MRB53_018432 [Persea americana]|uniref:Uncharacterized protein n=1 Tax=Persea americana TaxID=3435 RepID=A0ACC2M847_PERAE|nr:hypothetical protein MRB53_018432 [Persea americana]